MMHRIVSALILLLVNVFLLAGRAEAGPLFVVNSESNSIVSFDSSGNPTFVTSTASGGGPQFIAFDSHGNFLVSAPSLGTVHKYSQTGADLGDFIQNVPGASGLAFDSNGYLYVSSIASSEILRFSPIGANQVVFATAMDSTIPSIAFDAQGNLYAIEHNLNDIRVFSPAGDPIGVFGSTGSTGLDGPYDLKFDQQGNLYVASLHLNAIHEYSPTGADLGVFATGVAPLTGIAFDATGNLYAGHGGGLNTIGMVSPPGGDFGIFASTGLSNPNGLAFAPQSVPEPGTLTLAAIGLVSFGGMAWRKRRSAA